jgi:hypothetical protein
MAGIPLPNNIHPAVAAPADDRLEVNTYSEINSNGPLYPGMVRYVKDQDQHYRRKKDGTWVIDNTAKGDKGDPGITPTVEIGSVTSGDNPQVSNTGTGSKVILNFVLAKGDKGDKGEVGADGKTGDKGDKGDIGPAFNIDGRGTFANKSAFDGSEPGTAYLVEEQGHEFDGNIFIINDDGSWSDAISFVGDRGWTPVIGTVSISENKIVNKLVDFIGGKGAKPINLDKLTNGGLDYYVASTGYVSDVNLATNIKGSKGDIGVQGPQGLRGEQGSKGVQGDKGSSIYVAYAEAADGSGASFSAVGKTHVSFLQSDTQPLITQFTVWNQFQGTTESSTFNIASWSSSIEYSNGDIVSYFNGDINVLYTRTSTNPTVHSNPYTSNTGEWVVTGGSPVRINEEYLVLQDDTTVSLNYLINGVRRPNQTIVVNTLNTFNSPEDIPDGRDIRLLAKGCSGQEISISGSTNINERGNYINKIKLVPSGDCYVLINKTPSGLKWNVTKDIPQPIDAVTDGEMQPVTSNAVYDAIEQAKSTIIGDAPEDGDTLGELYQLIQDGKVLVVDTTHANILNMMNTGTLQPGTLYSYDYYAVYRLPYTNELIQQTTYTEKLIVQAFTNSSISGRAYSMSYPQDTIEINISHTTDGARGLITFREDRNLRVSHTEDWRNIYYRRYNILGVVAPVATKLTETSYEVLTSFSVEANPGRYYEYYVDFTNIMTHSANPFLSVKNGSTTMSKYLSNKTGTYLTANQLSSILGSNPIAIVYYSVKYDTFVVYPAHENVGWRGFHAYKNSDIGITSGLHNSNVTLKVDPASYQDYYTFGSREATGFKDVRVIGPTIGLSNTVFTGAKDVVNVRFISECIDNTFFVRVYAKDMDVQTRMYRNTFIGRFESWRVGGNPTQDNIISSVGTAHSIIINTNSLARVQNELLNNALHSTASTIIGLGYLVMRGNTIRNYYGGALRWQLGSTYYCCFNIEGNFDQYETYYLQNKHFEFGSSHWRSQRYGRRSAGVGNYQSFNDSFDGVTFLDGNTVRITETPATGDSSMPVLVRDTTTGELKTIGYPSTTSNQATVTPLVVENTVSNATANLATFKKGGVEVAKVTSDGTVDATGLKASGVPVSLQGHDHDYSAYTAYTSEPSDMDLTPFQIGYGDNSKRKGTWGEIKSWLSSSFLKMTDTVDSTVTRTGGNVKLGFKTSSEDSYSTMEGGYESFGSIGARMFTFIRDKVDSVLNATMIETTWSRDVSLPDWVVQGLNLTIKNHSREGKAEVNLHTRQSALGGNAVEVIVEEKNGDRGTLKVTSNAVSFNGVELAKSSDIPTERTYNTDEVSEGTTNKYFTEARAIASQLAGYVKAASVSAITTTTTVLQALGILEKALDNKVDKETGKGLSTNDYTTTEQSKLAGIAANANNYVHPASHSISEVSGLQSALDSKEANIGTKNTAFNKNFGTTAGTVSEGNHSHSGMANTTTANTFSQLQTWNLGGLVQYIANLTSANNSKIEPKSTGTEISTAVSTNVAAKSINTVTNATGDLHQFIKGTTVVAKVTSDGGIEATKFTQNGAQAFVDGTYINPAFMVGIYDVPESEKIKLRDSANWNNSGTYIGPPIVNTEQGQHVGDVGIDTTYEYICRASNVWRRIPLA